MPMTVYECACPVAWCVCTAMIDVDPPELAHPVQTGGREGEVCDDCSRDYHDDGSVPL